MTADAQQLTGPAGKGHGQKLSRKQEALIANLLTLPSYAAAARATGISECTLYRWMRLAQFQSAYREARGRVVSHAVARLASLSGEAAEALGRNLTCGLASAEIRAATSILENLRAMASHAELEERLAKVEQRLAEALAPLSNGRGR